MVADELIARLKGVPNISAVFDTEMPDGYAIGAPPVLVLQHISAVADRTIDGEIYASTERWQVSIFGANLPKVRAAAQDVIGVLHGYTSDTIRRVDYEHWPGTRRESAQPVVYHAPLDFMVFV